MGTAACVWITVARIARRLQREQRVDREEQVSGFLFLDMPERRQRQAEVLGIKHFTGRQKCHELLNVKLTGQPSVNYMQTPPLVHIPSCPL